MNVGFGVTVLARGLNDSGIDGIGHYTNELFKGLQSLPTVELTPYSFDTPINPQILGVPAYQFDRFETGIFQSLVLPWKRITSPIGESRVDLLHATDHLIPFVKGIPLVATIMDAIPLSHPEWCKLNMSGKAQIQMWRRMAKRADQILTISEYSKTEIVHYFQIDPERISVVPLGVDPRFFSFIAQEDKNDVLKKYDIEKGFFMTVGTLQPRKNLERLLEAMRILPDQFRKSHPLVIIGRNGWASDDLVHAIHKAEREGWCKWLKYVPDIELRSLLQSAALLVFPSLCEGFGLPILEAFASKVPVAASNTTSIPEVADDAAMLFDPLDPSDIAASMRKIIETEGLADTLIDKGLLRAKEMSWQRCAEKTQKVYEQVIKRA